MIEQTKIEPAKSFDLPKALQDKIIDLNKLTDGTSVLLKDNNGKSCYFTIVYALNSYKLETTQGINYQDASKLVENPDRIFISRNVQNFFNLPQLKILDKGNSSISNINATGTFYQEITEFKDPKTDFKLLEGQFIYVAYTDRFGDAKGAYGFVGKGSQLPNEPKITALLDKSGAIVLNPNNNNITINHIETYLPHREFGSSKLIVNGENYKLSSTYQEHSKIFQEFFPVGSKIDIPIDGIIGQYDSKQRGQKTTINLTAEVIAYSDITDNPKEGPKVLLKIGTGDKERTIAVLVEDLVDMSKKTESSIKTTGYDQQKAKAGMPTDGLDTGFKSIGNYNFTRDFNHSGKVVYDNSQS